MSALQSYLICMFCCALLFASCIEVITLDGEPPDENVMFIYGSLRTDQSRQLLTIERIRPFDSNEALYVNNATIDLYKNNEKIGEYAPIENEPGTYVFEHFIADTDTLNSYFVEIKTNERIIRSVPERVPLLAPIDSATHEYEDRVRINVYAQTSLDPSKNQYIRWSVDELVFAPENTDCGAPVTFVCYYSPETILSNIQLWNTAVNDATQLENFLVHTEGINDQFEYYSRHYFNVYQHSISAEAFEYWSQLKSVINLEGSVFDKPPASVPGNFYDVRDSTLNVLGYFEVSRVDTAHTFTNPGDHIEATREFAIPCLNTFLSPFDPRCCNCRSIPGSTTERPDWID